MASAKEGTSLKSCTWASVWMLLLQLCSDHGAAGRAYCVGTTVLLDLNGNLSVDKSHDVRWNWNDQPVTRHQKRIFSTLPNKKQFRLFENGTLEILEGNQNDSGFYSVEIFNKGGTHLLHLNFSIIFLEPIFALKILQSCLEGKNITVTCSADRGDDVLFLWKWVFNGTNQTVKSSAEPDKLTVHIQFEDGPPEGLICEARNAVSEMRAEVPACRGT
ncbi:T-cell surface antigen CD2-like [Salminus brasiliensis]|uniref:T-cell surface antigen CD2-like n=1 Tax=Salminus brasiliensis TaxID=930266 RepID=UPI003B82D67B